MENTWNLALYSKHTGLLHFNGCLELSHIPDVFMRCSLSGLTHAPIDWAAGLEFSDLTEFTRSLEIIIETGIGKASLVSYDDSFRLTIQSQASNSINVCIVYAFITSLDPESITFSCRNLSTTQESLLIARNALQSWLFLFSPNK